MSARRAVVAAFCIPFLLAVLPAQDPLKRLGRMPAQPAPGQGLDVQVLGADGKPAADATLYAIPNPPARALPRESWPQDDLRWHATFALEQGKRCTLSADGRARVAAGAALELYAFAGDNFGCASVTADQKPGSEPLRISLLPKRDVTVVLETSEGTPAVDVRLMVERATGKTPASRITDPTGSTVLTLVGHGQRTEPAKVTVLLPLRTPLTASIDAKTASPVRLRLPACGAVGMKPRELPLALSSGTEYRLAFGPADRRMTIDATRGESDILFPLVEPGVPLTALVRVPSIFGEFELPVDEVRADVFTFVVFDFKQVPYATCRLLQADGAVAASVPVTLNVVGPARSDGTQDVDMLSMRTNKLGKVSFVVPKACRDGADLQLSRSGGEGPQERVVVPAAKFGRGSIDLGDLQLQKPADK